MEPVEGVGAATKDYFCPWLISLPESEVPQFTLILQTNTYLENRKINPSLIPLKFDCLKSKMLCIDSTRCSPWHRALLWDRWWEVWPSSDRWEELTNQTTSTEGYLTLIRNVCRYYHKSTSWVMWMVMAQWIRRMLLVCFVFPLQRWLFRN